MKYRAEKSISSLGIYSNYSLECLFSSFSLLLHEECIYIYIFFPSVPSFSNSNRKFNRQKHVVIIALFLFSVWFYLHISLMKHTEQCYYTGGKLA